jgi:hypothetical protein
MTRLTNHAVASALLTLLSVSCFVPTALAQSTDTTTTPAASEKSAKAPAKKTAHKSKAHNKAVAKKANRIIEKGAEKAGAGDATK